MKIANLSTGEIRGGAYKAANRLHKAFKKYGINSSLLVQKRQTDDGTVYATGDTYLKKTLSYLSPVIDSIPIRLYSNRSKTTWSTGWFTSPPIIKNPIIVNSDVIIMYWVCNGYLSINSIRKILEIGKPVLWRLSDSWPFTGGCHLPGTCERYKAKCGMCPQLGSNRDYDLSRWIMEKKKYWKTKNLTLVCPSNWIMQCVLNSSLFQGAKVKLIPTGVDVNVFKPVDKLIARNILNLPLDKHLILYGAYGFNSIHKGGSYFRSALNLLSGTKDAKQIEIVSFGTNNIFDIGHSFVVNNMGYIHDDYTLALLYSACDVFVAPSSEDNLPNTVIESLACGTPCVAFNIGGMPDLIDHMHDGYLAKVLCPKDLMNGVIWALKENGLLNNQANENKISINARKKIIGYFNMDEQVKSYISLISKRMKSYM